MFKKGQLDIWELGKASQEKSGSLKGNSVSTEHNQSDYTPRFLVFSFFCNRVRVSSLDQNPDRQLDGIALDKGFTDKASARDTNRSSSTSLNAP